MTSVLLEAFRSLVHHKGARVGGLLLVALLVSGALAPTVAPYDPYAQSVRQRLLPPSAQHFMGTDRLGRDVLTRVLYGSLISLRVGAISVGIGLLIGVAVGMVAGYYGGWIETTLMRWVDALLAFPGILLALVVIAVLGVGLENVVIAVGVAWIPRFARLARGNALSIRQEAYVEAAQAIGCPDRRILLRHILPNLMGPIGVYATLQLGNAIVTAAGLSFLGLGAQPPTPEWGLMTAQGRDLVGLAWWVSAFPGLAVLVAVLSFNLIGDGLRDALDPRVR